MAFDPPYSDFTIPQRFREVVYDDLPPGIKAKLKAQLRAEEPIEPEGAPE